MEGLTWPLPLQTLPQTWGGHADTGRAQLTGHPRQTHGENLAFRDQLAEFASLLVFQMLQAMRQSIPQSGLLQSGFAHDLYMSLFDQEVARQVAAREAMGLVPMLQRQFARPRELSPAPGDSRQALAAYEQQQPSHSLGPLSRPAAGSLSSPFGWRDDPFEHARRWHNGIDIAAPAGSVVRAAAPGRVLFSGVRQGYGNLLILEHRDGYQTYYAHNAENLVATGASVRRAQPIARVGQTGRALGPHLHFEIRRDGNALDPTPLISGQQTERLGRAYESKTTAY